MSESFAELFEESLKKVKIYPGAIIKGQVIDISTDFVTIHAGLKSEGYVPKSQFLDEHGELEVQVGDEVELALDAIENGLGETQFSREKAKQAIAWTRLSKSFEANESVIGTISNKVKGGFTVEIDSIRAFLPGSLIDVRPVRDSGDLEGKKLEFKIIKLDQKRNNVVVSRRSVVEAESNIERETLLDSLYEGQEVRGVVKNLTDYGAFIDLGGLDGLLHITDMAWRRVKHPSEIGTVGQELTVKVLKFDKEKTRVSLGLKQLGADPWLGINKRYPKGSKLFGRVTNTTDYGCFVEIEEGVEGLVHVSEMNWTNKNIHPAKVVQLNTEIEVMVLDIDEERRRISLGLKQCQPNPWDAFVANHSKGDKISGKIKSITDFGMFVGLDGGIDGLVHLSDLSWNDSGEEIVRNYKKGNAIETVVLTVDAERERISLGIKQLVQDPYVLYISKYGKGTVVTGVVSEVHGKDGAVISLSDDIDGMIKVSEFADGTVGGTKNYLNMGDKVEAKIIGMDRKVRMIMLSIKAKNVQEEQEALRELSRNAEDVICTTVGDLLKEKILENDK